MLLEPVMLQQMRTSEKSSSSCRAKGTLAVTVSTGTQMVMKSTVTVTETRCASPVAAASKGPHSLRRRRLSAGEVLRISLRISSRTGSNQGAAEVTAPSRVVSRCAAGDSCFAAERVLTMVPRLGGCREWPRSRGVPTGRPKPRSFRHGGWTATRSRCGAQSGQHSQLTLFYNGTHHDAATM